MEYYWLIVAILAVWRITHLLAAEDGPWNIIYRLRVVAGTGLFGSLLDCFNCLSLWVATPCAIWIGEQWIEKIVLIPAISGGAILLERITTRKKEPKPALFVEDKEGEHVLLREDERTSPRDDSRNGHQ